MSEKSRPKQQQMKLRGEQFFNDRISYARFKIDIWPRERVAWYVRVVVVVQRVRRNETIRSARVRVGTAASTRPGPTDPIIVIRPEQDVGRISRRPLSPLIIAIRCRR